VVKIDFISFRSSITLWVLLLGFLVYQTALAQELPKFTSQPEVEKAIHSDPLGRETPNGTFLGFLNAAGLGNYQTAALYLELSPARRQANGNELAVKLKSLLDLGLVGPLKDVTNNAEGTVQEGVPLDHERIGRVSVNNHEIDIDLIRVNDSDAGEIWLFSADTLAGIPDLYDRLQARHDHSRLPAVLVENQFLEAPVWQWLALLAALPASAVIAWLLIQLTLLPFKLWRRYFKKVSVERWTHVSIPVWLIVSVSVNSLLFETIGFPILHRHYYVILLKIGLVIGSTGLVLRLLAWSMEGIKNRALTNGRPERVSLILLGQRLLKAIILVLAGLFVMGAFGFDTSTVLAGVGIGGLAISFGAQKTIENLFGGATILGDSVIHVGDFCRIGDRLGTIEDISLRSTRIRTLERTELSVPNGTLATINIENFSRRDKILFNPTLGLRYETTPDQLRCFLVEVHNLLEKHARVETRSARARLTDFSENALSVEIFSFVYTTDFAEFTAIREELMFQIMDVMTRTGIGFAFPSRTVYLGKDTGPDREVTGAVVKQTRHESERNAK
jgi:MscS family membrane protein